MARLSRGALPSVTVWLGVASVATQLGGWTAELAAPKSEYGSGTCADIPGIGNLLLIASLGLAVLAVVSGLLVTRPRRRKPLAIAIVVTGGSIVLWLAFAANGLCKVTNSLPGGF